MRHGRSIGGRQGGGRFLVSMPFALRFEFKQRLAVLNRLAILGQDAGDGATGFGFDLVHDFHGLNDAHSGVFIDLVAHVHEGFFTRGGGAIESADHR